METGEKIIVIGCAGSGKSEFSRRLRDLCALPLFHLDNIWWKPDRTHITREEFDRRLSQILALDRWIIDGDYSRTLERRLSFCDTAFFLDCSADVCLDGIARRAGKVRPDIPWTENSPGADLIKEVKNYRENNRPIVLSLFEKYPDVQKIVFEDRAQAEEWLENFAREKRSAPRF